MRLKLGCRIKKNRGDSNLGLTGTIIAIDPDPYYGYDIQVMTDSFWYGVDQIDKVGYWPPAEVWFLSCHWDPIENEDTQFSEEEEKEEVKA